MTEIIINWTDSATVEREIRRVVLSMTNDWIDGWLSGVTEFISFRGGRITSITIE